MFSKVADFASRHRKKLIFGGIVAGGMFVAQRYFSSVESSRKQIRKEMLDELKCAEHFNSIVATSNTSIIDLLQTLRKTLDAELSVDDLLEKVRTKPENRVELWEEIKIRVLTYGIASVYTETLLICALRTMMGIIGGQMLANPNRKTGQSDEVHEHYLNMIHHFLDKGVVEVIRVVKRHVLAAFGPIELKQSVFAHDFLLSFDFIKVNVKIVQNAPFYLMMDQWVLACASRQNPLSNAQILNQLILDTTDILQCSDCLIVLETLVNQGFSDLNATVKQCFSFIGRDDCPLVKLLPPLKAEIYKRGDLFAKESLRSSCSRDFLANVYEAFCSNARPPSLPRKISHESTTIRK